MCRSIILSKIAQQRWHDHPFSQRNKTVERVVGIGVGGNREGGRWTKFEEKKVGGGGGRQYREPS